MPHVFHIVDESAWQTAVAAGEYRPASLETEGFVHCSFAEQVTAVADARFRGLPGLVVLEVDPGALGAQLRVEDSYGEGTAYPHVYGPIPPAAVVAVHRLVPDAAGGWRFSAGEGDRA